MATTNLDVLIVGAGPTGLVLALWLRRRGVGVRIVDKTTGPGTTSRALVVHARTLEFYRQLGLADEVVARGLKFTAVNLWVHGQRAAHAELGDFGRGLTPYPEMVIFPQDQHERLLLDHLARAGVEVERETELVGFASRGDGISARTKKTGSAEITCEARFLAGCDGAHSTTRQALGIGFPGGTYQRVFYVADVTVAGPSANHELHLGMDDAGFLGIFPMKGDGAARLIGAVKPEAEARQGLTWQDVSPRAIEQMRLQVERVNWFSTYHVHHRVAERFQSGRAFLAGDAAHVHSPVGGQGMNTGIGDAVNLAWKLAEVVKGRAPLQLLESYQPERIAFARQLVATTDRAFTLVSRDGWLARRMRTSIVPRLLPGLLRRQAVRKLMFRTLSQTAVTYRGSALGQGAAGAVRGGDRLPWVASVDNYAPLASLDWQVHIHGRAPTTLVEAAARAGVPVHVFDWDREAGRAGLVRDAVYLVRPDGYVGLVDRRARGEIVTAYLDRVRSSR